MSAFPSAFSLFQMNVFLSTLFFLSIVVAEHYVEYALGERVVYV